MKTLIISLYFILCTLYLSSQNVLVTDDGTYTPDASAMLDVYSETKGILIPQISLTGVNDASPITSPATSLLVYNTATVTGLTPGYYYNTGTTTSVVWTRIATGIIDGSETKVTAGTNVTLTGTGTTASPYVVNASGVTDGTAAGQMLYWNGTAWVTVAPGNEGQILTFTGGVPIWKTEVGDNFVINFTTGKIWMDRNLGASQVATSSTDANAYGDLYQWGRAADGHQLRTSSTITTLSSSDAPGHGNFITNNSIPFDWRSPQNDNLWQGLSGTNNPCPSGYRLPTEAEFSAEYGIWSSNNSAGAFASPLKLPVAGYRDHNSGSLNNFGSLGYYWSSTVNSTNSRSLYFSSSTAYMYSNYRSAGNPVRCIKD